MLTIWKTELKAADVQTIYVPGEAEMLCAREQGETICVWYLCNPSDPMIPNKIRILGTGHNAPDDPGIYLGSASLQGGALIFHIFDMGPDVL